MHLPRQRNQIKTRSPHSSRNDFWVEMGFSFELKEMVLSIWNWKMS